MSHASASCTVVQPFFLASSVTRSTRIKFLTRPSLKRGPCFRKSPAGIESCKSRSHRQRIIDINKNTAASLDVTSLRCEGHEQVIVTQFQMHVLTLHDLGPNITHIIPSTTPINQSDNAETWLCKQSPAPYALCLVTFLLHASDKFQQRPPDDCKIWTQQTPIKKYSQTCKQQAPYAT